MSRDDISSWFRWITPIVLGAVTASNARIYSKIDAVLEKSMAYTDKQIDPMRADVRGMERELSDMRVRMAEMKRGRFSGGEGAYGARER